MLAVMLDRVKDYLKVEKLVALMEESMVELKVE
jgi:hypothetical protein